MLRPGQFDGTSAWEDFLYQFESHARGNHWSEKTMAVQLRLNLTGVAGAIVHKNPRIAWWSYQRIVEENEADRVELEQDAINVEIFINALADVELVQKPWPAPMT